MRVPLLGCAAFWAALAMAAVPAGAAELRFVTDQLQQPQVPPDPAQPVTVSADDSCTAPAALPDCAADAICCGEDESACLGACDPCRGCGSLLGAFCNCDGDPCSRVWTVRGGAIMLGRSRPDRQPLVVEALPYTGTVIDASEHEFGVQGGPDFSLIRHFGYWGVEARYFCIDQWTSQVGPVYSENGAAIQFTLPSPASPVPTYATSVYGSELNSFELNLRRQCSDRVTWLAGFRMLEMDDNIDVLLETVAPPVVSRGGCETRNRLYGFQLGLDAILWQCNRFRVEGLLKGGIYGNARGASAYYDPAFGPTAYRSVTDHQLAFVGDAGLFGVYQLTCCLAVRAGYQVMWADGLATASSQMSHLNPLSPIYNGAGKITGNDSNVYHGAVVSLEYTWCRPKCCTPCCTTTCE